MGLCDRCRLELADLLDCPDRIELTFCPVCGSQLLQGRWHPTEASIEDLVFEAAESAIGIHKDLEEPKLSLTVSQKKATQYLVEVLLTGEFEGLPAKERCQMLVLVRRTTCDRCR